MGPLVFVLLVVALMCLVWRFSPRRRMFKNRVKGEIVAPGPTFHDERTDEDVALAILAQRARDAGRGDNGFGNSRF